MREILFRGMLITSNEWVEGNLLVAENGQPYIFPSKIVVQDGHHLIIDSDEAFFVMPSTIGQFTGLHDRDGKRIFEGDMLRFPPENKWDENNYTAFEVFFHGGDANSDYNIGYSMGRTHHYGALCGGLVFSFKPKTTKKMVIIGNIHES